MLRKISTKGARLPVRMLSTTPQQNVMIQQVAEQQKDRAARVVPWFLKNMPVNIFIDFVAFIIWIS